MGFISTNVHITGHHPAGHAKLTVSTTTSILESRTHQKYRISIFGQSRCIRFHKEKNKKYRILYIYIYDLISLTISFISISGCFTFRGQICAPNRGSKFGPGTWLFPRNRRPKHSLISLLY